MSKSELKKHTLRLRAGDVEALERLYGPQGVSPTVVIRSLVSKFVDSRKSELRQPELDDLEIDLNTEGLTLDE